MLSTLLLLSFGEAMEVKGVKLEKEEMTERKSEEEVAPQMAPPTREVAPMAPMAPREMPPMAPMASMPPMAPPPTMPAERQTEYDIGPFKRLLLQISQNVSNYRPLQRILSPNICKYWPLPNI